MERRSDVLSLSAHDVELKKSGFAASPLSLLLLVSSTLVEHFFLAIFLYRGTLR